jgi:hypothetical protein
VMAAPVHSTVENPPIDGPSRLTLQRLRPRNLSPRPSPQDRGARWRESRTIRTRWEARRRAWHVNRLAKAVAEGASAGLGCTTAQSLFAEPRGWLLRLSLSRPLVLSRRGTSTGTRRRWSSSQFGLRFR